MFSHNPCPQSASEINSWSTGVRRSSVQFDRIDYIENVYWPECEVPGGVGARSEGDRESILYFFFSLRGVRANVMSGTCHKRRVQIIR